MSEDLSEYVMEHKIEITWLLCNYKSSEILTNMRAKLHNSGTLSPDDIIVIIDDVSINCIAE